MHMQGELSKSIRDAEKGFYPLGPLYSFKHTMIRRKTQPQNKVNSDDFKKETAGFAKDKNPF